MWLEICSKRRFGDTLAFPNLLELVNTIILLPHSNAEAERIFSILTDTKTKSIRGQLFKCSVHFQK